MAYPFALRTNFNEADVAPSKTRASVSNGHGFLMHDPPQQGQRQHMINKNAFVKWLCGFEFPLGNKGTDQLP